MHGGDGAKKIRFIIVIVWEDLMWLS